MHNLQKKLKIVCVGDLSAKSKVENVKPGTRFGFALSFLLCTVGATIPAATAP